MKGIATMASSLGSLGGPLGKAANHVANFIFSVKQMGAVGCRKVNSVTLLQ